MTDLTYSDEAISRDAYAVLLPAFGTVDFTRESVEFFSRGGVASLLGSTREEYVARRMSAQRRAEETEETVSNYGACARAIAGNVLIAIDYELGGVHRLHQLGPSLPHPTAALEMSLPQIEQFGHDAASSARRLGINLFLAPVVDIVTKSNPWLLNRTLMAEGKRVGEIASAFIRGVQSLGVAATAKHFPGHHWVPVDPFGSTEVIAQGSPTEFFEGLVPFRWAIAADVKAIMTGPVPTENIDPVEPSATSSIVVDKLRNDLRFAGLIISDDLDLPGVLRGRTVEDVAVKSLDAGNELLLLAAGPQIATTAEAIAKAVRSGRVAAEKLAAAAGKVRALAADSFQRA